MNVILPVENKMNLYRKLIYIIAIAVCVISIPLAVYFQYYKNKNTIKSNNETKQEIIDKEQITKDEFNNIFTNELKTDIQYDFAKTYEQYDLVFTRIKGEKIEDGKYNISLNIPYINIKQDIADEYNNKISDIFYEKAKSVMQNAESNNVIYTVQYVATIKDNILSLIIKSNLKEGNNAQRVIIQTYNYDIVEQKKVTLEDILNSKGIKEAAAESKIKEEIEKSQNQVTELEKLGYTIFKRDPESDIYKISNTTEFYIDGDDNLYLIYAYGNSSMTSEMDIVLF